MKFYDISLQLDEDLIVYPGDMPVKFHHLKNAAENHWNLSGMTLGTHSGTHLDTLLHIDDSGPTADKISLDRCYGKAIVLDVEHIPLGENIIPEDIEKTKPKDLYLEDLIAIFKTRNSSLGYTRFREDWVKLSPDGAQYLHQNRIKAVGIDSLSIGDHETHRRLLTKGIVIYEGLDLNNIKQGHYTFVGFPLKLKLEGSITRAVLIQED